MVIRSNSIQPVTSVDIIISSTLSLVSLEFHVLDQKGLRDIPVDSTYHLEIVAEAMAKILEEQGIKVKRQVNLNLRDEVKSFIAR